MVNKKGWLRIVEASIAITLILGAVLFVIQNKKSISQGDITEEAKAILNEIAKNASLRESALNYNLLNSKEDNKNRKILLSLTEFASSRINNRAINNSIIICKPEDFCELNPWPSQVVEVYSSERILSSEVLSPVFEPKKIKVYIWRI